MRIKFCSLLFLFLIYLVLILSDMFSSNASSVITTNVANEVEEEYAKIFRTNSYEEIYGKVRKHYEEANSRHLLSLTTGNYPHISEFLLEPSQETVNEMIKNWEPNMLLVDYYKATYQAYNVCDGLLRGLNRALMNYNEIQRRLNEGPGDVNLSGGEWDTNLYNPLFAITPLEFRKVQEGFRALLGEIKKKQEQIAKKLGKERASNRALFGTKFAVTVHNMSDGVAAPSMMGCCIAELCKHMLTCILPSVNEDNDGERLSHQLDCAAASVFCIINDLDMLLKMASTVNDDYDRHIFLADKIIRGKVEDLETYVCGCQSYMDRLNELEQHIYLACLTVNKSRKFLLKLIMTANE